MAYKLDYNIVVSDFKLHSLFYAQFETNTHWKSRNSINSPVAVG